MPTRPPRLCACGCVIPSGFKCEHQKKADVERKARFDEKRPTARKRGYDGKWQMERAAFLAAHPVCVMCGQPAKVVDHITPHRGDMKLFWRRSNWQALCVSCHSRKKQRLEN